MPLFKPREEVVTVFGGDYLQRAADLRQRRDKAIADHERAERARARNGGESAPLTLDEVPDHERLEEEYAELVAEAEASGDAVAIRLQSLPRRVWKLLMEAHPPREGNRSDALDEVNVETFAEALVTADGEVGGIRYRTIVDPANITAADLDELSSVDFTRLYVAAYRLNRGVPEDPKASLASPATQTSSETSS